MFFTTYAGLQSTIVIAGYRALGSMAADQMSANSIGPADY
jgi:hypothetical protein